MQYHSAGGCEMQAWMLLSGSGQRELAMPCSQNEERMAVNITHLGNLRLGSPQRPSSRTGSDGHVFLEDGEVCDVGKMPGAASESRYP